MLLMVESSTKRKRKIPWLAICLSLVVAIFVGFIVIASIGEKTGTEFSPDDFSKRSFSYRKINWLNWTLRKISYYPSTSTFEQSLVTDGWIKPTNQTPKTWHLVRDNVSSQTSPDFDASILVDYLALPIWEDWNADKNNKKKATALWRNVAKLARNYAYWAIPDLMDLPIGQPDLADAKFIAQVDDLTVEALQQVADVYAADSQWVECESALTSAIEIRETNRLLLARADAWEQLDKPDEAKKDREAAAKLSDSSESSAE